MEVIISHYESETHVYQIRTGSEGYLVYRGHKTKHGMHFKGRKIPNKDLNYTQWDVYRIATISNKQDAERLIVENLAQDDRRLVEGKALRTMFWTAIGMLVGLFVGVPVYHHLTN